MPYVCGLRVGVRESSFAISQIASYTNDYCEEESKNVENISFATYIRLLYCFSCVVFLIGFSCVTIGNEGIIYLIFSFFPSCVYLYLFRIKINRRIKFLHAVEMILYGAVPSIVLAGTLEYFCSLFFFHFCYICFVKEIGGSLLLLCSIVVFFYFFLVVAYVEEFSKILPMIFVQINEDKNKSEYIELSLVDNKCFLDKNVHKEDDDDDFRKKDHIMDKFKYIYASDILEYIFFSLCSSAGFSSTENLLYATQTTKQNFLSVIVLRNMICVLFHMCCSGVTSYYIAISVFHKSRKGYLAKLLIFLRHLFLPALFHAVYDYSIYFSTLNIHKYQVFFLTLSFTCCFFCMLLIFSVIVKHTMYKEHAYEDMQLNV
ncbi:hypothetical protein, conserved [Plasmodium gonderi]|uniref:Protease n=1 Tax=Plasmodium gonderi TaxID=77519 RepID=A0A1Y1JKN4_PLAGO|nr:hypothetical protein, conserved [Plasmodium gonderi]GAW81747.1 hypothetical protein, conserved [Plasmodium gonderi]